MSDYLQVEKKRRRQALRSPQDSREQGL